MNVNQSGFVSGGKGASFCQKASLQTLHVVSVPVIRNVVVSENFVHILDIGNELLRSEDGTLRNAAVEIMYG